MFEFKEETPHSLTIQSLELRSFRNYETLQLNNIGNTSVFVGENAVGKTSIVEAIQLLTDMKSFRSTHASELVSWNSDHAQVKAVFTDGQRVLEEVLDIKDGKRRYSLNGKPKSVQTLKGLLPAVIFTPDDLNLVKGPHSKRRESIDNLGMQLSKNFHAVRNDYQKLLKQKNQALKDGLSRAVVESINEVLAKVGAQYLSHRLILLDTFTPLFSHAYKTITSGNEQATIRYRFLWGDECGVEEFIDQSPKESLQKHLVTALSGAIDEEYARKKSVVGPHADHITYVLAKAGDNQGFRNASQYASQGQQRSITLASKMAELRTIQTIVHQQPVLLLDDVMSELDETRRTMFMQLVEDGIQTFITTTNLSYFNDDLISNAHIYHLPFKEPIA